MILPRKFPCLPRGQPSPGILQSGQQPSNGSLHIPQSVSFVIHRQTATAVHFLIFTCMAGIASGMRVSPNGRVANQPTRWRTTNRRKRSCLVNVFLSHQVARLQAAFAKGSDNYSEFSECCTHLCPAHVANRARPVLDSRTQ